MSFKNLAYKHLKESAELKKRQKKEWEELLHKQDATLCKGANVVGLAGRFASERDEHNAKFDKEKADLIRRQQKELEELQKIREVEESEHEHGG